MTGQHPTLLKTSREFKIAEIELAWLTVEEAARLLEECEKSKAEDLTMIVKICLATGARWGEAESLTGKQISPGKITFIKTKVRRTELFLSVTSFMNYYPKAEPLNRSLPDVTQHSGAQ